MRATICQKFQFEQSNLAQGNSSTPHFDTAHKAFLKLPEDVRSDPTLLVIFYKYPSRQFFEFKIPSKAGDVTFRSAAALIAYVRESVTPQADASDLLTTRAKEFIKKRKARTEEEDSGGRGGRNVIIEVESVFKKIRAAQARIRKRVAKSCEIVNSEREALQQDQVSKLETQGIFHCGL